MRKMKKIAVLCLAGSMALSLAACSGGSAAETSQAASQTAALAEAAQETTVSAKEEPAEEAEQAKEWGPIFADIVQNGKLKVGIIGNEPTFCFHTVEDGKDVLTGFEVEGMREMADRLTEYLGREVTPEFYESDFTGCMSALQANQIHFVTRLSPTDERKQTWLFTDVYHKSNECYVARKDSPNADKFTGTLEGVTVCGGMGTIDITMTKHLYPDAEIVELAGTPDLLLSVKNGKSDLACMNAVAAAMSVAANPDLTVVDSLTWEPTDEFDKGCGLCMAYGNEDFADWASGFFGDIKEEGLWDQMQSDAAAKLDEKTLEDFTAK
ncbi:MAG: amino acid ABC transporter substrate-binding protein [Hungatella sp.]|nr:amino acid ABC transporter substrate-binding protein [Hungatella sp.]